MAKSWSKRWRRGRLASWLGRIEGVEKPALLVGIGLVLYRVWRHEEPRLDLKTRWRGAIERVRRRFAGGSDAAHTTNGAAKPNSTTTPPVPPPS